MVQYRKPDNSKLNFWLATGIVGSYIDHPKQRKTQLFRREVTMEECDMVFQDPKIFMDPDNPPEFKDSLKSLTESTPDHANLPFLGMLSAGGLGDGEGWMPTSAAILPRVENTKNETFDEDISSGIFIPTVSADSAKLGFEEDITDNLYALALAQASELDIPLSTHSPSSDDNDFNASKSIIAPVVSTEKMYLSHGIPIEHLEHVSAKALNQQGQAFNTSSHRDPRCQGDTNHQQYNEFYDQQNSNECSVNQNEYPSMEPEYMQQQISGENMGSGPNGGYYSNYGYSTHHRSFIQNNIYKEHSDHKILDDIKGGLPETVDIARISHLNDSTCQYWPQGDPRKIVKRKISGAMQRKRRKDKLAQSLGL